MLCLVIFRRAFHCKTNAPCSLIFRGIDNEFHSCPCRGAAHWAPGVQPWRVHVCLVTPCSWRTQKRYVRCFRRALAALQHENQSSKVILTGFTLAASSIRRFSACAPRVCEWVRALRMYARVRPRMHAPSIPVCLCVCTARRFCTRARVKSISQAYLLCLLPGCPRRMQIFSVLGFGSSLALSLPIFVLPSAFPSYLPAPASTSQTMRTPDASRINTRRLGPQISGPALRPGTLHAFLSPHGVLLRVSCIDQPTSLNAEGGGASCTSSEFQAE